MMKYVSCSRKKSVRDVFEEYSAEDGGVIKFEIIKFGEATSLFADN